HRLMTGGAQVQDGQPAKPEPHLLIEVQARIVGAAVSNAPGHPTQDSPVCLAAAETEHHGKTAHLWWPSVRRYSGGNLLVSHHDASNVFFDCADPHDLLRGQPIACSASNKPATDSRDERPSEQSLDGAPKDGLRFEQRLDQTTKRAPEPRQAVADPLLWFEAQATEQQQPSLAVKPAANRSSGDPTYGRWPAAQPVFQDVGRGPQHGDHAEDDIVHAPNGRSPVGDGDHGPTPGTEHSVNFTQCLLVGLLVFYAPKVPHAVERVIRKWDVLDVPDAELICSAEFSRL